MNKINYLTDKTSLDFVKFLFFLLLPAKFSRLPHCSQTFWSRKLVFIYLLVYGFCLIGVSVQWVLIVLFKIFRSVVRTNGECFIHVNSVRHWRSTRTLQRFTQVFVVLFYLSLLDLFYFSNVAINANANTWLSDLCVKHFPSKKLYPYIKDCQLDRNAKGLISADELLSVPEFAMNPLSQVVHWYNELVFSCLIYSVCLIGNAHGMSFITYLYALFFP